MTLRRILAVSLFSPMLMPGSGVLAQETEPESEDLACIMEPKALVKLGSSEEGILREILVDRGDDVINGQVVAHLDSEIEEVNAELARVRAENEIDVESSRARLEFRRAEKARMEQLHSKRIVTTKSREEAAVEERLAQLAVTAAALEKTTTELELRSARARLERRSIRSSVNGVVVERNMAPGEYVHEQAPVVTIAQIDPLSVEVFVPISLYGTVEVGMPAEVEPEAPIGGSYRARVVVVDRVFDTASGTFGVRLALPNPKGQLPAGLKCRVRFLPMEAMADLPQSNGEQASPTEAAGQPEPAALEPAAPTRAVIVASEAAVETSTIRDIQQLLAQVGYDPGSLDGQLGPRTRKAIEAFQRDHGLKVDGQPSAPLKSSLEAATPRETKPRKVSVEPEASPAPEIAPQAEDRSPAAPVDGSPDQASADVIGWYKTFRDASAAMVAGDLERAAAFYSEALDSGSLPSSYKVLALTRRSSIHGRAGRDEAAIADLDRALEIEPNNTFALMKRGSTFLEQGKFSRAVQDYRRALEIDPTMIEAYYGRALAYGQMDEHARSIEDYNRISSLDPDFSAAYFNRALAYELLGDMDRATREYATLYALDPDFPGLKSRMQQLGLLQQ